MELLGKRVALSVDAPIDKVTDEASLILLLVLRFSSYPLAALAGEEMMGLSAAMLVMVSSPQLMRLAVLSGCDRLSWCLELLVLCIVPSFWLLSTLAVVGKRSKTKTTPHGC